MNGSLNNINDDGSNDHFQHRSSRSDNRLFPISTYTESQRAELSTLSASTTSLDAKWVYTIFFIMHAWIAPKCTTMLLLLLLLSFDLRKNRREIRTISLNRHRHPTSFPIILTCSVVLWWMNCKNLQSNLRYRMLSATARSKRRLSSRSGLSDNPANSRVKR